MGALHCEVNLCSYHPVDLCVAALTDQAALHSVVNSSSVAMLHSMVDFTALAVLQPMVDLTGLAVLQSVVDWTGLAVLHSMVDKTGLALPSTVVDLAAFISVGVQSWLCLAGRTLDRGAFLPCAQGPALRDRLRLHGSLELGAESWPRG